MQMVGLKPMTSEQKVKELMRPRFEVMSGHPDSQLEAGAIITSSAGAFEWDGGYSDYYELITFPRIFRELEWWEHREPEEMPQYVRSAHNNQIIKVDKWVIDRGQKILKAKFNKRRTWFIGSDLEPATEQEYNDYIELRKECLELRKEFHELRKELHEYQKKKK